MIWRNHHKKECFNELCDGCAVSLEEEIDEVEQQVKGDNYG